MHCGLAAHICFLLCSRTSHQIQIKYKYKPEIFGPCKPLLHGLRFSCYLSHEILMCVTDRDITTMTTAIILILLSLKYREKGGISSNVIPVFLRVFQYRCNIIVKNLVIPLMLMEKLS